MSNEIFTDTEGIKHYNHFQETKSSNLRGIFAVFKVRWIVVSRYGFYIILDGLMPLFLTLLPLLLGVGVSGSYDEAISNFNKNVGTSDALYFLFTGAMVFGCVTSSMWMIGSWMRQEQMRGTLETLYSTPISRFPILVGTSLYVVTRNIFTIFLSLILGVLVFNFDIMQGNVIITLLFFFLGFIPIFGMSILFGSLILSIKEIGPLINVLQWSIGLLSGLFVPVFLLPIYLRSVALMIPVSWQLSGIRSSMFDLSYFMSHWYLDFAVLFLFSLALPYLGLQVFKLVENRIRKEGGIGKF